MKTATVIGAGIGGPVAALVLDRAGYEVTLHEQRGGPAEFQSVHQLTLDGQSFRALRELGISSGEIIRYRHAPFYQESVFGHMVHVNRDIPDQLMFNVMWNDLHDALAKRCTVTYESHVTQLPETDLVIWADGVGSIGRDFFSPDRRGAYAGEMIFRGTSPYDDMTWFMSQGFGYQLVSYPCWDRSNVIWRGWTLMLQVPREMWDDTETLTPSQQDRLSQYCKPLMSDGAYRIISESRETMASPQLVWPDASQAAYRHGESWHCIMGDALGTVSPRTTMGANLAIREGMAIGKTGWNSMTVFQMNRVLYDSRQSIEEQP